MRPAYRSLSPTVLRIGNGRNLPTIPTVCVFCQHSLIRTATPQQKATNSTSARRSVRKSSLPKRQESRTIDLPDRSRVRKQSSSQRAGPAVVDDLEEHNDYLEDVEAAQEHPRKYAERARLEEKAAQQAQLNDAPNHQDYVPATTWDGLEMVGGEKEWNGGRKFHGFLCTTKYTTPDEKTVAIYRAVVEIFTALTAGRTPRTSRHYHVGPLVNEALQVTVTENKGKLSLSYPNVAIEQAVQKAGRPPAGLVTDTLIENQQLENDAAVVGDAAAILARPMSESEVAKQTSASQDLSTLIESFGQSWYQIPLKDPKIKFALIKRITRIIGSPLPDMALHSADQISSIISVVRKTKDSQAKLFDALAANPKLAQLSNVDMKARRVTPVDKDMDVGRWKIIEAELRRRDLPVLGHG